MQPDRKPEFRGRSIYPSSGRETRKAERTPEVPVVNTRTLGSLARRFPNGAGVRADGSFILRSTAECLILTPTAREPIITTHHDGNGSINGGTSKETLHRAKRRAKKG